MESKGKISVLHLITGLGGGGAERFVIDLALEQAKSGMNVGIVSLSGPGDALVQELLNRDIPAHFLDMSKSLSGLLNAGKQLRKILQDYPYTIIHCHMFHPLVVVFLTLIFSKKAPGIVFTPHNVDIGSKPRELFVWLTKWQRDADILFSNSMYKLIYKKRKRFIIPTGIRIKEFTNTTKKSNRFTIINVARLYPAKNQLGILKAVNVLKDQGITNFDVWLVGEGPMKDELMKYKTEAGLDNVSFLGFRRDVDELLQQADCFLLSSLWEGLPLSVLEAASWAVPVISTKAGTISDFFSGTEVLYVQQDAEDIAAGIKKILADPAPFKHKAQILMERIRTDFSIGEIAKKHKIVYDAALQA